MKIEIEVGEKLLEFSDFGHFRRHGRRLFDGLFEQRKRGLIECDATGRIVQTAFDYENATYPVTVYSTQEAQRDAD